MAATYEYIIKLTDQMSGTMNRVSGTSGTMVSRLESMTKKQKELSGMSKDLSGSIFGLKQRIDLLRQEKELIDPSNLDFIRDYNTESENLEGQLNKLDGTGRSSSFLSGLTSKLKGLINPATISAAVMAATSKSALGFEQGMSKINITAQMEGAEYDSLQRRIAAVAKDNKMVIELAPESYNQIISQTGDATLSLEIMDAAMKGARAASVDMTTVSAALAQSLSVIGKEASALDVLDTFLTSKRVGAGEFTDFARYLPGMIAGASNLGVHYKEVAGVFAYMTGKGQSAEKAAVLIENTFKVLGRGNIRKNLSKAGVDVFDDEGKIRGLVDIFGDLTKVMSGMADEQKSTFLEAIGLVDKETKNAFALLTSDVDKLTNSMRQTKESTGETDRALKFSENGLRRATDLWTRLRNIGFEFGRSILPVIHGGIGILGGALTVIEPILSGVATLFNWWFSGLEAGSPLVYSLTAALISTTAAINAATIATQAKAIWDGIATGSTKIWAAAQWLLNSAFWAFPLTWVVVGITALVGVITMCMTKVEGWGHQWEVVVSFMKNVFDLCAETIKFEWSTLVNSLMIGLDKIKLGWYNFREAVGLGSSAENQAMIQRLNEDMEERKEAILQGSKKMGELAKKTAGSFSWELSWKKDVQQLAGQNTDLIPQAPAVSSSPVDFAALMKGLEKSGKGKGSKSSKIDLNDTVSNLKGTSVYTAIASKLNPVKLASLSAKAAATIAIPTLLAGTPAVTGSSMMDTSPAKTEYMEGNTKPIAVDVVSLSSTVLAKLPKSHVADPILLSSSPALADLPLSVSLDEPDFKIKDINEEYQETSETGKAAIRIDRFCDQIVIHIAEANGKGYDQIRDEVEKCMMELFDDYGA